MKNEDMKALIGFLLSILVGIAIAVAGSTQGVLFYGYPLFILLVALIYVIQWLAFIPAFLFQTEKFYDLTGSLTYITIMILAVLFIPVIDARSILLFILVLIWAGRLGSFLVRRILRAGKDGRFDDIKPKFIRFLNAWSLQALWITFTVSAALVAVTAVNRKELGIFALIGTFIWLVGFSFEVIADLQKNRFRADPANKGKFIKTGLWSLSRHPNYFGEITLWVGILSIALPVLRSWQWIALVSPVFVALLITQISGVPILEKRADAKWGKQPDYQVYKKSTPVLIPRLLKIRS